MAIKISDIPSEGFSLEFDQTLELLGQATAVTANLGIKPGGKGILQMTGRVQAAPTLECSRCLRKFSSPVDAAFNIELAPMSAQGTSSEHELVRGELDMEFYQGEELEPIEFVREQLLIALPMVPLHDPGCKGLCSVCGTDLNEAECGCRREQPGAFSALKDLLKK